MNAQTLITLAAVFLGGCAAPAVMLHEDGRAVKVGKSDPADNYSEIGPITAIDGSGCGAYGYRGTYDRAVAILKNKAAQQDGNYVQIFTLTEPHFRPGCFDNVYKINGTLFKKISDSPSPVPIIETKGASDTEKLRDLKSLLDEGIITEEEFQEQKANILSDGI